MLCILYLKITIKLKDVRSSPTQVSLSKECVFKSLLHVPPVPISLPLLLCFTPTYLFATILLKPLFVCIPLIKFFVITVWTIIRNCIFLQRYSGLHLYGFLTHLSRPEGNNRSMKINCLKLMKQACNKHRLWGRYLFSAR